MVKIKGSGKPPTGKRIITVQVTSTAETTNGGDTVAAFEKRVAETCDRLVKAFEDGDEFVDIDLDRELPGSLWLRTLSAKDAPLALGEHRKLRLTWELDEEDDDLLWVVISSDGVELARREFEPFLDEHRWNRIGLEWLAEKLGVDGPAGQPIREAMPRERKH